MAKGDTVGDRIAQARRELAVRLRRDITKAALAEMVGVAASSVGDWEANVSVPKGGNLVQLARVLGVSESYIIAGDALPPATPFLPPPSELKRLEAEAKAKKKRGRKGA